MRRPTLFLAAAVLLLAPRSRAEVCAELNAVGHVSGLSTTVDLETGIYWDRTSGLPESQCLNSSGDSFGDGKPTCSILAIPTEDAMKDRPSLGFRVSSRTASAAESSKRRTPIVVWSRLDGTDREIVFSVWDYRNAAWRSPAFVERIDNAHDDFDPQLAVRGKRI